jgi:hypothetical protein
MAQTTRKPADTDATSRAFMAEATAPRWLADARRTRLTEPPPVAHAEGPADHECAAPARAVRSSSRAGAAAHVVAGAWHRLALSCRLLLLGLRRASQHPSRRRLALPTALAVIMCMATLLSTLHSTGEVFVSTDERAAAPPPQASPTPGAARATLLPPPPPPPPAADGAAQHQHVAVAIRSIHSGLYWQVVGDEHAPHSLVLAASAPPRDKELERCVFLLESEGEPGAGGWVALRWLKTRQLVEVKLPLTCAPTLNPTPTLATPTPAVTPNPLLPTPARSCRPTYAAAMVTRGLCGSPRQRCGEAYLCKYRHSEHSRGRGECGECATPVVDTCSCVGAAALSAWAVATCVQAARLS